MTLGPGLLLLRAVDVRIPNWLRPAVVFGRVPFFYFAMHVVAIHVLVVIALAYRYGAVHWAFESSRPDQYPFTQPPGWPVSLAAVYASGWVGGSSVALVPLVCRGQGDATELVVAATCNRHCRSQRRGSTFGPDERL